MVWESGNIKITFDKKRGINPLGEIALKQAAVHERSCLEQMDGRGKILLQISSRIPPGLLQIL